MPDSIRAVYKGVKGKLPLLGEGAAKPSTLIAKIMATRQLLRARSARVLSGDTLPFDPVQTLAMSRMGMNAVATTTGVCFLALETWERGFQ
jgi:hypothetical protein